MWKQTEQFWQTLRSQTWNISATCWLKRPSIYDAANQGMLLLLLIVRKLSPLHPNSIRRKCIFWITKVKLLSLALLTGREDFVYRLPAHTIMIFTFICQQEMHIGLQSVCCSLKIPKISCPNSHVYENKKLRKPDLPIRIFLQDWNCYLTSFSIVFDNRYY